MKRDPNLFEAFRDATAKPAEAHETTSPRAARSLGVNPKLVLILVISLTVVFSAGYLSGGGRKEVAAKGAGDKTPAPTASWQPAGPAKVEADLPDGSDASGAEAKGAAGTSSPSGNSTVSGLPALYNPQNLYTVLAITYSDVPSMQGRARDIAEFLRQHDLPAFEPISRSGNIEILVGAAETQGALQELTAKLRGTRGPTGRSYDFQSAYVVNIDDHLDRD